MIRTENYTRNDGVILIRTYSDEDYMIRQNETGALYCEAVDPQNSGRTYEETDIKIEFEEIEVVE